MGPQFTIVKLKYKFYAKCLDGKWNKTEIRADFSRTHRSDAIHISFIYKFIDWTIFRLNRGVFTSIQKPFIID